MLWRKRNVFRFFLKAGNDSESLRSRRRLFQTCGAATEKADHRKQCYSEEQTKILGQMNEVNAQVGAKVTKQTGNVADPVFENSNGP